MPHFFLLEVPDLSFSGKHSKSWRALSWTFVVLLSGFNTCLYILMQAYRAESSSEARRENRGCDRFACTWPSY